MIQQVIEGTPDELREYLSQLDGNLRLTLLIPAGSELEETPENLRKSTPEERSRALDEIAEMNRDLPALPPEAFSRETLYEERL